MLAEELSKKPQRAALGHARVQRSGREPPQGVGAHSQGRKEGRLQRQRARHVLLHRVCVRVTAFFFQWRTLTVPLVTHPSSRTPVHLYARTPVHP